MDFLNEIVRYLKEGDSHFVLAVGNSEDWIAMIEKDEQPDEPFAWGAGDTPWAAVGKMLDNAQAA